MSTLYRCRNFLPIRLIFQKAVFWGFFATLPIFASKTKGWIFNLTLILRFRFNFPKKFPLPKPDGIFSSSIFPLDFLSFFLVYISISNEISTSTIKWVLFPNAAFFYHSDLIFKKYFFALLSIFGYKKPKEWLFNLLWFFDFSFWISVQIPTWLLTSKSRQNSLKFQFFQPDFFCSLMALVFQGHRLN